MSGGVEEMHRRQEAEKSEKSLNKEDSRYRIESLMRSLASATRKVHKLQLLIDEEENDG